MRLHWLPLLLLLLLAGGPLGAEDITIYRCTDAGGRVTLRDTPCPGQQRQQTRDMLRPQEPPAARPSPPTTVAEPSSAAPEVVEVRVTVAPPPQPMYRCTTFEGERYVSAQAGGNPRWVPLWVLGHRWPPPRNPLGDRVGAPAPQPSGDGPGPPDVPPAVGLALTPGTWIRDQCRRMSRRDVCTHLRERRDELQRQHFNAQPSGRAALQPERQQVDTRLRRECGIG